MNQTTKTASLTTNNLAEQNAYLPIDLPFVETQDFKVMQEAVKNDGLPSGWDWQYAVINKLTDIVEMRVFTLAAAVVIMQNCQSSLDKVITGEINGFGPIVQPQLGSTL